MAVPSASQIHMKTMPAAMYRLLTAQEQPVYIWATANIAKLHPHTLRNISHDYQIVYKFIAPDLKTFPVKIFESALIMCVILESHYIIHTC